MIKVTIPIGSWRVTVPLPINGYDVNLMESLAGGHYSDEEAQALVDKYTARKRKATWYTLIFAAAIVIWCIFVFGFAEDLPIPNKAGPWLLIGSAFLLSVAGYFAAFFTLLNCRKYLDAIDSAYPGLGCDSNAE